MVSRRSPRANWLRNNIEGQKILDIGFVGMGGDVHRSLRAVKPEALWIGLDYNAHGVASLGLSNTIIGDGFTLPFASASLESIVIAEVVEHLYDLRPLIQEVSRVLESGGYLFLTTPNPYNLFLWSKFWLLSHNLIQRSNYRRFLGAPDHCIFWEPLSLMNLLYDSGIIVEQMTTKNVDVPFIRRFWTWAQLLDISFWPFDRLGFYTCLIGRRVD